MDFTSQAEEQRQGSQTKEVRMSTTTLTMTLTPTMTAPAAVRLTRRGRLLVTLVLTTLLVVGLWSFAGPSLATRETGRAEPVRTIEVERGQTLWSIAADVAEPGEIREMVYRIEKLNSLPGPTLAEGQLLAVPVG